LLGHQTERDESLREQLAQFLHSHHERTAAPWAAKPGHAASRCDLTAAPNRIPVAGRRRDERRSCPGASALRQAPLMRRVAWLGTAL